MGSSRTGLHCRMIEAPKNREAAGCTGRTGRAGVARVRKMKTVLRERYSENDVEEVTEREWDSPERSGGSEKSGTSKAGWVTAEAGGGETAFWCFHSAGTGATLDEEGSWPSWAAWWGSQAAYSESIRVVSLFRGVLALSELGGYGRHYTVYYGRTRRAASSGQRAACGGQRRLWATLGPLRATGAGLRSLLAMVVRGRAFPAALHTPPQICAPARDDRCHP